MSEPIDDKTFDDYLSRQSQVSRQYRGLEGMDVPPDLDRRVLDQAAQAVEKKRRGSARVWRTWSVPVALAASTLLALAVVIESGLEPKSVLIPREASSSVEPAASEQDRAAEFRFEPQESLSAVEAPPAAAPASDSVRRRAERSEAAERRSAREKVEIEKRGASDEKKVEQVTTTVQRDQPGSVMPTPVAAIALEKSEAKESAAPPTSPRRVEAPPSTAITQVATSRPAAAPPPPNPSQAGAARDEAAVSAEDRALSAHNEPDISEVAVTANRRQRTITGPRGTLMRQGAPSRADSEEQRREDDPVRWLEFIRELRRDGKTEEADRQWSEFQKIHPEYAVTETDSARPQR